MNIAYLNNKFVPLDKAKVSVLDGGFLYGDGAFETMRAYNGVVFRPEKHISRLFRSLKALGIRPGASKRKIEKKVRELLKKNRFSGDAYIKVIITRGRRGGLLFARDISRSFLVIYALKYKAPAKTVYTKGIKVSVSRRGFSRDCPMVEHKTLNYLPNILWRRAAKKHGFDDTILLNTDGFISEASTSNVFIVKGKKIYTPSLRCGILPGITREEVIRLAKKFLDVSESRISPREAQNADEVFLTNSLAEIVPVVKIGKKPVGKGKPGPLTMELRERFKAVVSKQ